MEIDNLITILSIIGVASCVFYAMFRVSKYAFLLNITMLSVFIFYITEGNDLKRNIAILEKWICHFGQFKIFVIVNDSAKAFFLEVFKKSVNDTFGFSASGGSDDGCATFDVI